MSGTRKAFVPTMIIFSLLLAIGSCCIYWSFHPRIIINRAVFGSGEDYYESMMIRIDEWFGVPMASRVHANLRELGDWNNQVVNDLYENHVAPLHITVSGEVKDGKTLFWYEGYATTKNGETVDYREEMTFDFVLVPDDELLSN